MDDVDLFAEAQERFEEVCAAEGEQRSLETEDLRFATGDQWHDEIRRGRETDQYGARPVLTVNRTRQFINQVVNEGRQARAEINVIPMKETTFEAAEVFKGLLRCVQKDSRAQTAYVTALWWAVTVGRGYYRLLPVADPLYPGLQKLEIRRIANPFSIYMDPMADSPCGDDARWCFVTEHVPVKAFEKKYKQAPGGWDLAGLGDSWRPTETVMVAEYMSRHDNGVTWAKLAGGKVIEKVDWPWKCNTVVRVVGDEWLMDGRRCFAGMTRHIKDPQRMYNYWCSVEAELISLAPKAPWIGPVGFAKGMEKKWRDSNRISYPYLEYHPQGMHGQPLPPPSRQHFDGPPTAVITAKQQCIDDMKASVGMYDPSLGNRSNQTSGIAIRAVQAEGDTATFHYLDNMRESIVAGGRAAVEMIPHLYDSARVVRILGDEDDVRMIAIDPKQADALIGSVFNPAVGAYDVSIETGAAFGTKRQEAAAAMTELARNDPTLMQKAGDLIVKQFDFPGARDISQRLALFLPPQVTGQNPIPPEVAQQMEGMQAALQEAQATIGAMQQELQAAKMEAQSNELEARTKVFEASARLDAEEIKAMAAREAAMAPAEEVGEAVRAIGERADQLVAALQQSVAEQADRSAEENRLVVDALKGALAEVAQSVEVLANRPRPVAVEPVRGKHGRIQAGVVKFSDGSEGEIRIGQ